MSNELSDRKPIEILLVEDNIDDVELTREALKHISRRANLHRVENGHECMAFLRRQSPFENAPYPDLVLLDLNLPRMNGREALTEIVADKQLRYLPVVVLTTSAHDEDVFSMYELRCSSYIVKPVNFDEFQRLIQSIIDYWFSAVTLPPRRNRDV